LAGSQPISSFDGARNNHSSGYQYRAEAMSSSGASSGRRTGPFEFLSTTWAMLFFAAVALQAVVCVAFEA